MRNANLSKILLKRKTPIVEALKALNETGFGIAVLVDDIGRLEGVATDGDIRRAMVQRESLAGCLDEIVNPDPIYLRAGYTMSQALRLFNNIIRQIPVVDEEHKVIDILHYSDFCSAFEPKAEVTIRAKAPMRISFAGGGTDVNLFMNSVGGMVLSATINRYCYGTLKKRHDHKIVIRSTDYLKEVQADRIEDLVYNGELDLIKAVIKLMKPQFGFELEIYSDAAPGSGLGGSASAAGVVAGLINYFRSDRLDEYQVAEIAYQAERVELNIAGGWQDQYASVFGGFNYIEFKSDDVIVHPLKIKEEILDELECSLLFCNTGITRNSDPIIRSQLTPLEHKSTQMQEALELTRKYAIEMKNYLLRGDLTSFGKTLHQAWLVKKEFSTAISNDRINQIYEIGIQNGALGGKVLGAGGGGYIVFFCPPIKKHQIARMVAEVGVKIEDFFFDFRGLRTWKTVSSD